LKNYTYITSLIIILIAIFLFGVTYQIRTTEICENRLGPRFFPRVVLGGIILLSTLLLLKSKKIVQVNNKKSISEDNYKRFRNTIFLSFLFGLLFCWLNGIVAIFIFFLGMLLIWNVRKISELIFYPAITTFLIYIIFHVFLSVRFPRGILGNLF